MPPCHSMVVLARLRVVGCHSYDLKRLVVYAI
jgi:hypothetical protein